MLWQMAQLDANLGSGEGGVFRNWTDGAGAGFDLATAATVLAATRPMRIAGPRKEPSMPLRPLMPPKPVASPEA